MKSGAGHPAEQTLTFAVRVAPKRGRDAIEGWVRDANGGRMIKARIAAAPEKGKANDALIALLAQIFAVPQKSVTIASGAHTRLKRVRISGDLTALSARLTDIREAE